MNIKNCFKKGLLRKCDFSSEIAAKEIENAKRHLKNASHCFEDEIFDLAIVSVYTSMFHAARAILFRDGIKERSHICVMIYIKEEYSHLKEYATILDTYRRSRHTMLYGIDVDMIADDASQGISLAEEFIIAIEKELNVGSQDKGEDNSKITT